MVTFTQKHFFMSGSDAPAAAIDIKSIGGLTANVAARLSSEFAHVCKSMLGIHPERLYITMAEVPAKLWGWNAATFG
jgi:hypothetical protein